MQGHEAGNSSPCNSDVTNEWSYTFVNHTRKTLFYTTFLIFLYSSCHVRGLLEKYPTFDREKETGLLGALDT